MKVSRYPLPELLLSIFVVVVVSVLPWPDDSQRVSIMLFTSLSVVIALVWYFPVKATSPKWRWVHGLLGLIFLLSEWFYFGQQETGILDIFLIPVGIGVIVPVLCLYFRSAEHSRTSE